jgi:hypothetical protein
MSPHLPLLIFLSFVSLFAGPTPDDKRVRVAGWTLDIRQDRFTRRQTCKLFRRNVYYERRALVFHLPTRPDTSRAAYRIDDGPPFWVTSDAAELADLGFSLHDDDLTNPSGGVVRIVVSRLVAAHTVTIEPKAFGSHSRFRLDGLQAALDVARTRCIEADFDRTSDF